jgi:nitrate/nitrite transporter NarK
LIADFGLDASDLGLLTAAYFLAFAAFQIPLGILLDRFGPRRVQAALLLVAALGAAVFAAGNGLAQLMAGRALIGLGVAGGLMASLKAIVLWFPRQRWPLINGTLMACGGLGALSATAPLELAVSAFDWRGVFAGLSGVTVAVSTLLFFVVPEAPAAAPASRGFVAFAGVAAIFRDRTFWRLAPVAVACMGSGMAIQGLWAGPWLRDVAGLGRDGVAQQLAVLAVALTAGFILSGALADVMVRWGFSLLHLLGTGAALYLGALLLLTAQVAAADYWVWAAFGLLGNLSVISYALLSQHFPVAFTGRANTALNVLVFIYAFAAQFGIGAIIDFWPPTPSGGYQPAAYGVAFGIVAAIVAAAFVWLAIAPRRGNAP